MKVDILLNEYWSPVASHASEIGPSHLITYSCCSMCQFSNLFPFSKLVLSQTRENTLQLLIFSLVTFPSTEFRVDTVANKVAKMVRDTRRRVRQAALDTLAVLAQIYESEVLSFEILR